MNEDKDLVKLMLEALEILILTKLELIKLYEKYGCDGTHFNTNIDLKFTVDDKKVEVEEKWRKINE